MTSANSKSTPKTVRIGTRGSPLAIAQAQEVKERLINAHASNIAVEIDVISTKGDRIIDRSLSEIGGKGLFTEEIEERLADGRIDIAVHSSKDMPTTLPEGLVLSCFMKREIPNDGFISTKAKSLNDLEKGAIFGTSSLRRKAMLLRLRPDLLIIEFRGNVQTRLRKLEEGVAQATLLAMAVLNRLGMSEVASSVFDLEEFPPAPGQGAICIESRIGDEQIDAFLKPLQHQPTAIALSCERSFLAGLDGSCRTPIAGYASISSDKINFHGMILSPDGSQSFECRQSGSIGDAHKIGESCAEKLRQEAGEKFFSSWVKT